MAPKYRYQYAVAGQDGEPGEMYQVFSRFSHNAGAAVEAAEDYHARPEAAGAAWPLVFILYDMKGAELARHTVKTWNLPCFMVVSPERPDSRQWLARCAANDAKSSRL